MTTKNLDIKVGDRIRVKFNDLSVATQVAENQGISDPLELEKSDYEVIYISNPCACGCNERSVYFKIKGGGSIAKVLLSVIDRMITFLSNLDDAVTDSNFLDLVERINFFANYKDQEAEFLVINSQIEITKVIKS